MTVRTKQGLAAEYGTLFPTAGDPKIIATELRSYMQDLIDSLATQAALDALAARVTSLEGGGGGPASHSLYVGWSDDRLIATADLTAAADADDVSVEIPARATNGYLFVATLETNGTPTSLGRRHRPKSDRRVPATDRHGERCWRRPPILCSCPAGCRRPALPA